jgi:predicted Ser/Thr protein kinase
LRPKLAREVERYQPMLEALVTGQLSADDFQTRYFEMYEDDPRPMSKEVFRIVDGFFADVDSYVDDPALRDPSRGDLGPDELKERARELLRLAGFADQA